MLKADEMLADAVKRYRFMEQTVMLGRGFNLATAYEWALKMKEMTYISAEPYSSADFMHGPIAIVHGGFPVMTVAQMYQPMLETLTNLHKDLNAELIVISNQKEAFDLAITPVPLPADLPDWLSPIAAILPAQLFAYHLARVKGHDPENPRIIHKVAETK
jgi:glutamine---fructose-6-phosphate transaminase (isomerizing)